MTRVSVQPSMLRWARERAGLELQDLVRRFPQLVAWERGERSPTLRQLEAFARAVRVPVGYLFLPDPPREPLPVPDLRTVADRPVERPSPELLDTLYLCQRRTGTANTLSCIACRVCLLWEPLAFKKTQSVSPPPCGKR